MWKKRQRSLVDHPARTFSIGETLFREGEASDYVGYLLAGELEVIKHHAGQDSVIGLIREGEYFGEMGVLEGRVRSATLRARQPVSVEFLSSAEFLSRVSTDSSVALSLLSRLSARLRLTDTALTEAIIGTVEASAGFTPHSVEQPGPSVTLLAGSDRVAKYLPADGHHVGALPFFFGRVPDQNDNPPPIDIDFTVADGEPSRLAPVHFAIVWEDGRLLVRDFYTEFGTEVNGTLLGGDIGRDRLEIGPGETRIVAGGRDSPFAFRLLIE